MEVAMKQRLYDNSISNLATFRGSLPPYIVLSLTYSHFLNSLRAGTNRVFSKYSVSLPTESSNDRKSAQFLAKSLKVCNMLSIIPTKIISSLCHHLGIFCRSLGCHFTAWCKDKAPRQSFPLLNNLPGGFVNLFWCPSLDNSWLQIAHNNVFGKIVCRRFKVDLMTETQEAGPRICIY